MQIGVINNEIVEPKSNGPFSGITEEDVTGKVISEDPDDWRPITAVGMEFKTAGAYPNPCSGPDGFSLCWRLITTDSVLITVNDSPRHVLLTSLSKRLEAGQYCCRQPMGLLKPGIYRVYFNIVRPDTTYVTYGDVQVN